MEEKRERERNTRKQERGALQIFEYCRIGRLTIEALNFCLAVQSGETAGTTAFVGVVALLSTIAAVQAGRALAVT